MFRIYADVAKAAFRNALRAWPVAFSVLLYAAILFAASTLLGGNFIGGLIVGLIFAGCFSSYLSLLEAAVVGQKVRWGDVQKGFKTRFWDVISVMFALWLIQLGVGFLSRAAGPSGGAIGAMAGFLIALFFNVVPELLYQGQSRSFALLADSSRFILKHWIGWFFPHLVLALALLAPLGALSVSHPGELVLLFQRLFSLQGPVSVFLQTPLWAKPLVLLFFHFAMVFRGLLFKELQYSNPRLRAFRAAQRGS